MVRIWLLDLASRIFRVLSWPCDFQEALSCLTRDRLYVVGARNYEEDDEVNWFLQYSLPDLGIVCEQVLYKTALVEILANKRFVLMTCHMAERWISYEKDAHGRIDERQRHVIPPSMISPYKRDPCVDERYLYQITSRDGVVNIYDLEMTCLVFQTTILRVGTEMWSELLSVNGYTYIYGHGKMAFLSGSHCTSFEFPERGHIPVSIPLPDASAKLTRDDEPDRGPMPDSMSHVVCSSMLLATHAGLESCVSTARRDIHTLETVIFKQLECPQESRWQDGDGVVTLLGDSKWAIGLTGRRVLVWRLQD